MITQGPYKWERTKSENSGKWYATLVGKPNKWNDRLVTAMREDLAQFPYAVETGNARLLEKSFELYASLQELVDQAIRSRWIPHKMLVSAVGLLKEIEEVEHRENERL